MNKAPSHIPSLDGIRAVSFSIVFLAHAGLQFVPGGFGVTVFFFLSGFLITTLMRQEFAKNQTVSLRLFYLRRVLRILPPFYLVLGVALALSALGLSGGPFEPLAAIAQVFHYANYWIVWNGFGGFPPGTGVYWSLAVEEHFYLLFPWLFLGLQRVSFSARRQALALLALAGLIFLWRCVLVYGLDAPADRTSVASDTRFDSLLFGCALALYESPVHDRSAIRETTWKFVLLPVGVLVLLATFLIRDDGFRESIRYSAQGLALLPVFVCAIRYPDWLPMRPLNHPAVAYVGLLSYTLYLVHQVVLSVVDHLAPSLGLLLGGALSLGASLLIAAVVHQVVEKPFAKLRKRLHAPVPETHAPQGSALIGDRAGVGSGSG